LLTLAYRVELLWLNPGSSMSSQARFRQRSLLDQGSNEVLPKEVEEQALELLIQLLIDIIPVLEGGKRDEQDQQ
jgi:hypothetical protein